MSKQVERRTAAERRQYMQEYHARRKEGGLIPPRRYRDRSPTNGGYHAALDRRNDYVETFGLWPERRHEHPESLERTPARVKR